MCSSFKRFTPNVLACSSHTVVLELKKLISSAAYHATRSAGFIKLSSERTLRDYTHYFKSRAGFQIEVNQQLQKEAKIEDLPENRRFCALLLDEMKLKENLIYDKYEGEIIGFTNLGNVNNEILNLERDALCIVTQDAHLIQHHQGQSAGLSLGPGEGEGIIIMIA